MRLLSEDEARLIRCVNGRLSSGRGGAGVAEALRGVCGVQAQLPRAAALALRARTRGLVLADVVRAREGDRSAVRAWFMRGTIYLVATEDAGWLLAALGPVFVAAGRRRLAQLRLDDEAAGRGVREIRTALIEHGPLTRDEVVDRLRRRGVMLAPDSRGGYASTHLLRRAALEGLVVFGPDRDGEETYALAPERGVRPYQGTREEALAELARRHLAAHGPAGPEDLAAWSGLPMREVRAAWASAAKGFEEVRVGGKPAWVLPGSLREEIVPERTVRLLAHFDPHLLGHRDRGLVVPSRYARRVQRGGGFVRPVATLDGRAIATWDYRDGARPGITVEPFGRLPDDVSAGLEAEAEDVGRFLGTRPTLTLKDP